ncbi:hypothetical protein ACHAPT_011218 [Fusarium lateritium]
MVSSALSFILGSLAIGAVTAKPVASSAASSSTASSSTASSCVIPVVTTVPPGAPTAVFITQPEERDGDDGSLLSIDFEDGSFDHWGIDSDLDFAYDIRDMTTPNGESKVFKILEPAAEGFAFVNNDQVFQLEDSPLGYKVSFTAKCSWISQNGITDWNPVGIILKHQGGRVFSTKPINGNALGNGWIRFEEEFLNEGITGDTTFTIRVEATGWSLDWYFDDISVVKIE